MSKERELLKVWFNGGLHPENYEQLLKETEELLAQPEPELIGFVAEPSVGFDVSRSVQSMPLLWLGKLEHGDKLYRVGKKGE
jgi:hypothetical protein